MRYSQLFGRTVKTVPSDIKLTSHKYLHQGGFVRQISAGRYAFLPLGFFVWQKIYQIIKKEMDDLGAQQVITPTLQPIEFWQKNNRDVAFGEEMLVVEDHHGASFAVGATAEGMMVELVKKFSPSYKDLPVIIYQFSNKFRDEKRPRGGLLRVREFMMKDAYSFTATEEESLEWYQKFYGAYERLAKIFDLEATPAISDSGAIGGDYNHEFMVRAESGESTFFQCEECGFAMTEDYVSAQKIKDLKNCPECQNDQLRKYKAIEWGHVFKQDNFYTQPHEGFFVDQDGQRKPMWMGAYGIGIGRTMATIVETHHDEKGIIWPESVAPFQAHLVDIKIQDSRGRIPRKTLSRGRQGIGEELYLDLLRRGVKVLYDDREDVSVGEKFADADLTGIPVRLVLSDRTLEQDSVEIKKRSEQEGKLVPLGQLPHYFN